MSINVSVKVSQCDFCPHAKVRKVYTGDSWDDTRAIKCIQLNKDVYSYLDWYDKSPVPDECPFKENEA